MIKMQDNFTEYNLCTNCTLHEKNPRRIN